MKILKVASSNLYLFEDYNFALCPALASFPVLYSLAHLFNMQVYSYACQEPGMPLLSPLSN